MEHDSRRNAPLHVHTGRPSSFGMQEPDSVFEVLGLGEGDVLVDLGCGLGEYALYAARLVGDSGKVFALDKAEHLVTGLKQRAAAEGLENIVPMVADATEPLPLEENSVDVCLFATVLHIPGVMEKADILCAELDRILRPEGRLVIIECHEKDLGFGPPQKMRLSPQKVRDLVEESGFKTLNQKDLGYNYLIQFIRI